MNHQRIYFGMIGLLIISFFVSIFGTYEINNILNSKSGALASQQTKITSLNSEQLALLNAKSELKKYASLYNIAQSVVPQNKDQTQTVRQIINIAAANNIIIGSITFPSSNLGSTISSSVSTVSIGNPNLSQLVKVPAIPGVYTLPITITSSSAANQSSTFNEFIGFLQGLENNRQTAQVTSLLITPNSQNPNDITFNISLNIYIKPGN